MEPITRGRGSRVGYVLVDEKDNFLLRKLGWMTSQGGLIINEPT